MVKLKFIINKKYLADHLIRECFRNRLSPYVSEERESFIYRIWEEIEKIKPSYFDPIREQVGKYIFPYGYSNYESIGKEIDKYIEQIIALPAFCDVMNVINSEKNFIEKQWNSSVNLVSQELSKLGIEIEGEVPVYLSLGGLKMGMRIENIVYLSHSDKFPNYDTIILWHELIHFYLYKNNLLQERSVEVKKMNELLTETFTMYINYLVNNSEEFVLEKSFESNLHPYETGAGWEGYTARLLKSYPILKSMAKRDNFVLKDLISELEKL